MDRDSVGQAAPRQRIDKWLWFARVVKSRTLAQKLALSGRVRINREKCDSASDTVRIGDVVTIASERGVRILKIVQPGARRGPPPEAEMLYEDLSPAPADRVLAPAAPARTPGSGRPTKRDQRRLAAFRAGGNDDLPGEDD